MRKFDKMSARLSLSPKHYRTVAEKNISFSSNMKLGVYFWGPKVSLIQYILGIRLALSTFLGSKMS